MSDLRKLFRTRLSSERFDVGVLCFLLGSVIMLMGLAGLIFNRSAPFSIGAAILALLGLLATVGGIAMLKRKSWGALLASPAFLAWGITQFVTFKGDILDDLLSCLFALIPLGLGVGLIVAYLDHRQEPLPDEVL